MKLTWPGNLTDGHIVSPQGVAAALQRLYEDRSYCDTLAQAAYQNATRPEFKWSAAVIQWKKLFEETIRLDAASAPLLTHS
jgi:glycosyltransferase involved in cell wall biosynthesis